MQKNSKEIKFNGASFNAEFAASKTEEEYLEHGSSRFFLHLKLSDREELLREAYRLSCKVMEVEPRGFAYQIATPVAKGEAESEQEEAPPAEDQSEEKPAETKRQRGR